MKLERYTFLEKYPHQIDKTEVDYKAYDLGNDREGYVFLVYEDIVEIYSYNEGPYILEDTAKTLKEAVDITAVWC